MASLAAVRLLLPLAHGLNSREHPMVRVKRVRAERAAVRAAAEPFLRTDWAHQDELTVRLVRYWGARCRAMDDDGLRGALKACRDEVAALLGVDDRDPCVAWTYHQEKSHDGQHHVGIEVSARVPGACPTCGHVEVPLLIPAHAPVVGRFVPLEALFDEPPLETPDGSRSHAPRVEVASIPEPPATTARRRAAEDRAFLANLKGPERLRALATSASRPAPKKGGAR